MANAADSKSAELTTPTGSNPVLPIKKVLINSMIPRIQSLLEAMQQDFYVIKTVYNLELRKSTLAQLGERSEELSSYIQQYLKWGEE